MKPSACAWLPVSVLLCLTACSSGPPPRTYVLTPPLEEATLTSQPASLHERIVIRRVLVPDYLDTTDILLRDGTHEVKASATGRWGERLSQGLTHAVAADLVVRLPANAVVFDTSTPAPRQLLISVSELDLWPDGRCVLAANWTIVDRDAAQPAVSGSGRFDASPAGSTTDVGDARLVDALARTVAKLADQIALSIRQITERSRLHAE